MAYRVGGCATKCSPAFKSFYRPSLDCKHTVEVGDVVSLETSSGSDTLGCVISVRSPVALVRVGSASKTENINQLILSQAAHSQCSLGQSTEPAEPPPSNILQAVINGPMQVSAKSCDPVTLDAYQSTNSGPASALNYKWIVPFTLSQETLSSPTVTFKRLSPGTYTFGLAVSNRTHTVQAKEFTMVVVSDFLPLVTMACPKSVCTHANAAEYTIEVNLQEQTMLELDVDLATDCYHIFGSGGELLPLSWMQLDSTTVY